MDRRLFLGTLTGGLLATRLVAEGQQVEKTPQVGLLRPGDSADPVDQSSVGTFLTGLREAGYADGKNIHVEMRYAHGKFDRLAVLAHELAALQVYAVVTSDPYSTRAMREASDTIPIVVALDYETDPVVVGWIKSLARPGGNLTGIFCDHPEMSGKLLQFLKETIPGLAKVAVLWDETISQAQLDATQRVAAAAGITLKSLGVRRVDDLASAFGAAARERPDGMIVLTSPLLSLSRVRIAEMALKRRLPGITMVTNFPAFGFLMAYGPNQPDAFRRSAQYVARMLSGARVADLPVQRPEKFELVINLKTVKALGLTIPPSLLQRADQVIQ